MSEFDDEHPWSWDWEDENEEEYDEEYDEDTIDIEYEFEDEEIIYENVSPRQNRRRKIAKKAGGFAFSMFLFGAANAVFRWAMNIGKDK